MNKRIAGYFILILLFSTFIATAQWSSNPAINNAVCNAVSGQYSPAIISDGSGGAIIAWWDGRQGSSNSDIYAQKINANGVVQWATNGVAICTAQNGQAMNPTLVSDGAGGAIITWSDARVSSRNIFAQRINATGDIQWAANGVSICAVANLQEYPMIVSDGTGGAIITWPDRRNGSTYDIYAQRIDQSGNIQWAANGVAICTAANDQYDCNIIEDGLNGAIITWHDLRSGTNLDIYAQRVNATGTIQWANNGTAICTAANDQNYPTLNSDGAGGAIIAWQDSRASVSGVSDLYAQKIDVSGIVQWTVNGLVVCNAANFQYKPASIADGSGGAIISWYDSRNGAPDIYAQRINSAGISQWTNNGIVVSDATNFQDEQKIISDGSGGSLITWQDKRNGTDIDIYAQHIDATGTLLWPGSAIAISTATGNQVVPVLIENGSNGAIIAWQDARAAGNDDIYAQLLNADGTIPVKLVSFNATYNPGEGSVDLSWVTSQEINTLSFELEKTNDAVNFIPFASVTASGNFSTENKYDFKDLTPIKGRNYYRLKTVDLDRNISYSKIATVNVPESTNSEIRFLNPVNNELVIKSSKVFLNTTIKIINILGQLVFQKEHVSGSVIRFDTSKFAKGDYVVILNDGSNSKILHIRKQ